MDTLYRSTEIVSRVKISKFRFRCAQNDTLRKIPPSLRCAGFFPISEAYFVTAPVFARVRHGEAVLHFLPVHRDGEAVFPVALVAERSLALLQLLDVIDCVTETWGQPPGFTIISQLRYLSP